MQGTVSHLIRIACTSCTMACASSLGPDPHNTSVAYPPNHCSSLRWDPTTVPVSVEHAAAAITSPHSAKLVALHATLFSPTLLTPELAVLSPALSTLELAVQKGYLTNFPCLTLASLRYDVIQLTLGKLSRCQDNLRLVMQGSSWTVAAETPHLNEVISGDTNIMNIG